MRGKNNFKLNDVKRAIQSVTRAGLAIENVEITKVDAADQKRPA